MMKNKVLSMTAMILALVLCFNFSVFADPSVGTPGAFLGAEPAESEICAETEESVETDMYMEAEWSAESDMYVETDSYAETEEPAGMDVYAEKEALAVGEEAAGAGLTAAGSLKEAGTMLRKKMVARTDSVDLAVAAKSGLGPSDVDKILDEAYKHTGVGNEGDYLRSNVVFTQISFDNSGDSLVFHFSFCYATTSEQEAAVAAKVKDFKTRYSLDGLSAYKKILAIYEFVGDTVTYDYANVNKAVPITSKKDFVRANYVQQTAYGAAVKQKAVCEGYALWFYRLALEYGIDTRMVTGTSFDEDHGWNIVKLGEKYYHLDPTWESGIKRSDWNYFLKSTNDLYGHDLSAESKKLLKNYKMASSSYTVPKETIKKSGIYSYVRSYGAIIVDINTDAAKGITVPATLGGLPVVSLDNSIMNGQTWVTNATGLTLQKGIYRMKGFWDFSAVSTVSYPASFVFGEKECIRHSFGKLKTVKVNSNNKFLKAADGILYSKNGKNLVLYPRKAVKTLFKVPSGVVNIMDSSVRFADKLQEVVLPESIRTIEAFAFDGCNSLKKINFPKGLKSIDEWAFGGTKLSGKITLPAGIQYLGGAVFANTRVSQFAFSGSNTAGYSVLNGAICFDFNNEGVKQVLEAPHKKVNFRFTVPEDYSYVCDNSFLNSTVKEISLNEKLINIGSCAFEDCPNLSSLIIPASVRSINERSFGYNGKKLKSVTVLSKDLEIWGEPFNGTTTTVYGYKGSTIEAYCKNYPNLTFKEITGPVYNWGVKGERCYITLKNDAGKILTYPCTVTQTPVKNAEGNKIGVTKCKASYKNYSNIKYVGYVKMKNAKLSYTSTVYSGTLKKPKVKVTDEDGRTVKNTYYKVTYSNNKKAGKAKVTIKGKGKYKGTISKTFTIKPKATAIVSLTAKTRAFTVKWKKKTTQTTGYQIQYARGSGFSKAKTVTLSGSTSTQKKITNLASGKKYYVRVRTYKNVSGKKYFSAWSGTKSVTVK